MNKWRSFGAGCTITILAALLVAGCGRSSTQDKGTQTDKAETTAGAAMEGSRDDPLEQIFRQVDELASQGATNEVLATFQAALDDPSMAGYRQPLFNGLLRFLLFTEQAESAKSRMLAACRNDAELAVGALGLVYSYEMDHGGVSNAIAWTETVLAVEPLPGEVRRNMREWNLMGYVELQDDGKVLQVVDGLVRDAPLEGSLETLSRAIDTLFEKKRTLTVEKVVQQMGRVVTSDPGTQHLLLFTSIRLQAVRGEWAALGTAMPAAADKLPDADLNRLLRHVLAAVEGAGETALADTICKGIIDGQSGKAQSFTTAGRRWVDNVMRKDPALLPERLGHLQQADFPVQQICGLYMRYFYDTISMPATVGAMKELGMRLAPLATDDETRNAIRTMVLDASFVLEDYDTSLSILRSRIAGRDEAWHTMAISKVQAHKALKENKPRDAVKYFREFMATVVAAKEETTSDPETGLVHSKAMILGRNAKRIGDILKGTTPPDETGAQKAYGEARDYFKQALEGEKDPEVIKLIEAEAAGVP